MLLLLLLLLVDVERSDWRVEELEIVRSLVMTKGEVMFSLESSSGS